jgi:uncharacterized protein
MSRKESLKEKISRLLKFNNTPQEIALGIGIGAFIAILPVYGLHTTLVIIIALLVRRVNKIALLIGTNVSLPPSVPLITWIGYNIGKFMLGNDYPVLNRSVFRNFNINNFMNYYYPLFIGSIIEGLICGVILYFLTLWFIKRRRAKICLSVNMRK